MSERFDTILQKMGLDKRLLLKAFSDLCGREWWTQVWVLQEYSFASTDLHIILGRFQTQAKRLRLDMDMLAAAHMRAFPIEADQVRRRERHYYPLHQARSVLSNYRFSDDDAVQYEAWIYMLCSRDTAGVPTAVTSSTDAAHSSPMSRNGSCPELLPFCRLAVRAGGCLASSIRERRGYLLGLPKRLSPQLPSWIPDFSQRRLMHEYDVMWEVGKDKHCFDPYVAICGGEMALYGRPINTVSAVYPIKASGYELVRRFWLLEMGFMALSAHYPPWKRHLLHVKFADMYATKPLHSWLLRSGRFTTASSISELLSTNSQSRSHGFHKPNSCHNHTHTFFKSRRDRRSREQHDV